MSTDEEALLARKTWRTLEPLHAMIYFVPEAAAAYERIGITGRSGYFASRAAPMGPVVPEVVIATFFNFNPELIYAVIPKAWEIAAPEEIVAARLEAVDGAFRRTLGSDVVSSREMSRAAELARALAESVRSRTEGRPLCAGHVDLPWPTAPHQVLWHAQSILREFRGDGHVALLLTHGLSGIEALIVHASSGKASAATLRSTRGWSEEQWDAAADSLQERDWLTASVDPTLSPWGIAQRRQIEAQTDLLAAVPYAALGEDACAELRTLARPWSKAFSEALFR